MSGPGGFKVFVALHVVDHASRHLLHFSTLARKAGSNVASINKHLKLMGSIAAVAVGSMAIGSLIALTRSSSEAAKEVENLKLQMRGLGMTGVEVSAAVKQVQALSRSNPTLKWTEGLHLYKDIYSIMGHTSETNRAMPFAAKFVTSMRGVYGDRANDVAYDAFRASELQMGGKFNAGQLQKLLDVQSRVAWMTGGRVSPKEVHSFMKNTPYGRMAMDPSAMANMVVLMQEMGGSRAGTAFQAMDRGLIAKQFRHGISKERMEQWASYGLIQNIQRDPRGKISDFTLKNQEGYQRDKVGWLFNTFGPALAAKGIDITDPRSIPKLAPMFSSQTAAGALVATTIQKASVLNRQGMFNKAYGVDEGAAATLKSPTGKLDAYHAQMTNLQAALGASLLPLLVKIAEALTPIIQGITKFVSEHPRITQFTFALAGIGAAALVATGAFLGIATLFTVTLPANITAGGVLMAAAMTGALAAVTAAIVIWGNDLAKSASSWFMRGATDNPNTPERMALRAKVYQDRQGEAIKRQNAVIGPSPGKSGPKHISLNAPITIHTKSDRPNEIALAVRDVMKDLVTPKTGDIAIKSTGMMHGYA